MKAPSSGPLRGTLVSYKWGAPGVIALDDGREVSFDPKVCHELVSLTRGTPVVVGVSEAFTMKTTTRREDRITELFG